MREAIESVQLEKLAVLFEAIRKGKNRFYTEKLGPDLLTKADWDLADFKKRIPFTTKAELIHDRETAPPFGRNLNAPLREYSRFCQTSGSTGTPLPWLDTGDSWEAMLAGWRRIFAASGLTDKEERVFFAFSFGPFLGFWTAFEAAASLDFLCLPGGGMSSEARLRCMERYEVTALCCTPTYALRLGALAAELSLTLPNMKCLLVAGEPGGSIPETRKALERLWPSARVVDHHGLTETGPVSHPHPERADCLAVMEESFLAEVIDSDTGDEVPEGEEGELVLTTLDRIGCPLLRYRTGDFVRKRYLPDLALEGGILGRVDDMVLVRGVNIYPSAIEKVVRRVPTVVEYQVEESIKDGMTEIVVAVEFTDGADVVKGLQTLEGELRNDLQLRIPVRNVAPGSLPRYEFKSKRWIKHDC
ncbi:MAG: AMP-binding protein [Verrucomicrobiota bacterium]